MRSLLGAEREGQEKLVPGSVAGNRIRLLYLRNPNKNRANKIGKFWKIIGPTVDLAR